MLYGKRVFGRFSFRAYKFVHGVSAKEVYVGNILATLAYNHLVAILINRKESNYFIVRTFGVELYLTVLIGNAERFYGGLSRVYDIAAIIDFLTERFRPDLTIPVGKIFKPVGIRHHNRNVFALLHSDILRYGGNQSGVFIKLFTHTQLIHIRRAGKHFAYIYTEYRRRKKSHGAKFRKSSANSVGNIESFETFLFSKFDKVASVGRSSGDNMVFRLIAQLLFK